MHRPRLSFSIILLLAAVSLSLSAAAVELRYKWNKGDVHRFRYRDDSRISMEMGGMGGGMQVRLQVESRFSMKVLDTLPGGKARVLLRLQSMELIQNGKRLPALKRIPPAARKVVAVLDRRGRAEFKRMVTVYIRDNQVYLGVRRAELGPGRASASVSAGGPEGGVDVDLVAHIDPASGRITAAAKVRERPAKLRRAKIEQDDPSVDVLPKRIFEMMVLPEGDIARDGQLQTSVPGASLEMKVSLESLKRGVATLHFETAAQAAGAQDEPAAASGADEPDGLDGAGQAEVAAPDDMPGMEGDMPGMGGGMPGMGGGMPGMGGGMPGMGGDMPGMGGGGMQLSTDARTRFDVQRGRLLRLDGIIRSEVGMAGMGKLRTESRFELDRI